MNPVPRSLVLTAFMSLLMVGSLMQTPTAKAAVEGQPCNLSANPPIVCTDGSFCFQNLCSPAGPSSSSSPSSSASSLPPRFLVVDIGTRMNLLQLMVRIVTFLAVTIFILCTGLFVVGAFLLTASRGKDDMVQKGRDFMTGAVLGMVTVLGSYAILRTVFYFLYVL